MDTPVQCSLDMEKDRVGFSPEEVGKEASVEEASKEKDFELTIIKVEGKAFDDDVAYEKKLSKKLNSTASSKFSRNNKLLVFWEKYWIILFIIVLLATGSFSAVSLFSRYEGWLVSDSTSITAKIGWNYACIRHKDAYVDDDKNISTLCSSRDSFTKLANVFKNNASQYIYSYVCVSAIAWILPLVLLFVISSLRSRDTCCHGYTIAVIWIFSGFAILLLTSLFIGSASKELDAPLSQIDVVCDGVIVCKGIQNLDECKDIKCQFATSPFLEQDVIFCSTFGQCVKESYSYECGSDGLSCSFKPGMAYYSAVAAGTFMVILGGIFALGSYSIGINL